MAFEFDKSRFNDPRFAAAFAVILLIIAIIVFSIGKVLVGLILAALVLVIVACTFVWWKKQRGEEIKFPGWKFGKAAAPAPTLPRKPTAKPEATVKSEAPQTAEVSSAIV